MVTVEGDIFDTIKTTFEAELTWPKSVIVDKPITNIDAIDVSYLPLVQAFWNTVQSTQQPQRGKTYTLAPLVIQIVDQATSTNDANQQRLFEFRNEVRNIMMRITLPAVKAVNKDFVDFGYEGRTYDIHSFGDGLYLAELFFTARFNEDYGQC